MCNAIYGNYQTKVLQYSLLTEYCKKIKKDVEL